MKVKMFNIILINISNIIQCYLQNNNNNDNSSVFANIATFGNVSINWGIINATLTSSLNTIGGNINTLSGNINTI